jgi:hypothetical protein
VVPAQHVGQLRVVRERVGAGVDHRRSGGSDPGQPGRLRGVLAVVTLQRDPVPHPPLILRREPGQHLVPATGLDVRQRPRLHIGLRRAEQLDQVAVADAVLRTLHLPLDLGQQRVHVVVVPQVVRHVRGLHPVRPEHQHPVVLHAQLNEFLADGRGPLDVLGKVVPGDIEVEVRELRVPLRHDLFVEELQVLLGEQ